MESFATGLKRIYDACSSDDVRFEFKRETYGFTVRFYRHSGRGWNMHQDVSEKQPEKQPKIKKSDEIEARVAAILELIKQNPYIARGEIVEKLGITEMQVRTAIDYLKKRKSIYHEGSAKGGYWVVTDDGKKE